MSSKPETVFIKGVHNQFKVAPHFEKMHNPYRGGMWDIWYSGHMGDLWIEYKWLPRYPTRQSLIVPNLSSLQLAWGFSRSLEGRRLAVVVGTPEGGILFTNRLSWKKGVHVKMCRNGMTLSKQELAAWIFSKTGACCDSSESSTSCEDRRIVL